MGSPAAHYAFGAAAGVMYSMCRKPSMRRAGRRFSLDLCSFGHSVFLSLPFALPDGSLPASPPHSTWPLTLCTGVSTALVYNAVRRKL